MSAEVAMQKFSFPFSSGGSLSQRSEATQNGCIQVKAALELHNLQGSQVLSEPGLKVIGVRNEAQGDPKPDNPQSAVLSRKSVFEKLTAETEDQRPMAKRQLSSESAARTITVVKKSAVRKEGEDHRQLRPKTQLGQKPALSATGTGTGKRRRRKDLFSSSEVFHRVDSHVIRAGAEVRPLRSSIYSFTRLHRQQPKPTGQWHNPLQIKHFTVFKHISVEYI